jgi:A118 family predicted phage portal protein
MALFNFGQSSQSLGTIFEHPLVDSRDRVEYDRIQKALRYYKGSKTQLTESTSNKQEYQRYQSKLNVTKLVTRKVSTILFNESCEINTDNEFVSNTLNATNFKRNLANNIEDMLATGGIVIRPYYDDTHECIKFNWGDASSFIPLSYDSGQITEAIFPIKSSRTIRGQRQYYTLLEIHQWIDATTYCITNELYKSEDPKLIGARVALAERYPKLEERIVIEDLTRPLFIYMKTAGYNNINPGSPLGLGILDNSWDTVDRINRIYDEFDQEIKLGRRRIAVPETMMTSFDSTGEIQMAFDPQETIYTALPGMDAELFVHDLTSPIRTQQYESAINFNLRTLESELGFAEGTFAFTTTSTGQAEKTATEVVSRNSITFQTRQAHITEIEQAIRDLIITVCELGMFYDLDIDEVVEGKAVEIDFDDSIFIDQVTKNNMYVTLVAAGLISKKQAAMEIFKISEDEAEQYIKDAQQESVDAQQAQMDMQTKQQIDVASAQAQANQQTDGGAQATNSDNAEGQRRSDAGGKGI